MAENYLLVNKQTNIADNQTFWDGNTSVWSPPSTHLAIPQATTIGTYWKYEKDLKDYVEVDHMGQGSIGDTWDGTKFRAPKPDLPEQPVSTGLEQA